MPYKQEDEHDFLSNFLFSLVRGEFVHKISIYIQISKDPSGIYFLKSHIHSLFNPKNVIITNDYSEADLIVCDTLIPQTEERKVFLIRSITDNKHLSDLTSQIQKLFEAKNQHI